MVKPQNLLQQKSPIKVVHVDNGSGALGALALDIVLRKGMLKTSELE